MQKFIKKPLLLIAAVIICLLMIRLGIWQLDRAQQKQTILDQARASALQAAVDLNTLLNAVAEKPSYFRYRKVALRGQLLAERSIFIDNQVLNNQVGYWLITPLKLADSNKVVLLNRGWLPVGAGREQLPSVATPVEPVSLQGRLNIPPAQPPLWQDDYVLAKGALWQYLPIEEYAKQHQLDVLPLLVEVSVVESSENFQNNFYNTEQENKLQRQWPAIDDKWVAKHRAYALQWFSMAAAFFIACVVLTIISLKTKKP